MVQRLPVRRMARHRQSGGGRPVTSRHSIPELRHLSHGMRDEFDGTHGLQAPHMPQRDMPKVTAWCRRRMRLLSPTPQTHLCRRAGHPHCSGSRRWPGPTQALRGGPCCFGALQETLVKVMRVEARRAALALNADSGCLLCCAQRSMCSQTYCVARRALHHACPRRPFYRPETAPPVLRLSIEYSRDTCKLTTHEILYTRAFQGCLMKRGVKEGMQAEGNCCSSSSSKI